MTEQQPLIGQRIAFIGLGVMGFPMAGHLVKAGADVVVFNRTESTAERWQIEHGGSIANTPAAAAAKADVVCVCVGNDDDVRSVVTADAGALEAMQPGALLIDHTTASQDLALELAEQCHAKSVGFLDAPVSGGQAGAENGQLTVMVGGEPEQFARAQPVFAAYAKQAQLLGSFGAGQLTKMVNQICIAGVLQGLAEGFDFAERAGLDIEDVVAVISQGAAQSWQMENRAATMAQDHYEFGFAVDWMRKDLGIALNTARRLGARLPMTALVDQFYGDVQAAGGGRWDTSSLLRRLRGADA